MLIDEKIASLQNLIKRKVTYEEIAPILGLNSGSALRNWAYRKRQLADFEIEKIDEAFGINSLKTKQNEPEETVSVDYYPEVFGSCGSGAFVVSDQKELLQVPKRLFSDFSPVKKYSVVKAKGESMRPTLQPDDKLIIEHWNGEQIIDNEIYIFCYKDEIFVKRLIKNVDEIIILSDNDEAIYRPRFIEKEEINNILIIGRIVGLMREF